MNEWIIWATSHRRDELLLEACSERRIKRARATHSNLLRGYVADGALVASRALAHFAQNVRAKA